MLLPAILEEKKDYMRLTLAISLLCTFAYSKTQVPESRECGEGPRPVRVSVRHIEPNGIGYNQGYTTLDAFIPYTGSDKWVYFLDGRVHIFNNGRPAVNAGLGTRYMTANRGWGLNAYYDYRNTKHYHYNQVAMGLESIGQTWDYRINGYLPIGKKLSKPYNPEFGYFQGHYAMLREQYEYALGGFNAEVGAHVDTWKHFPLYFAAGPYYLRGHAGAAWGGEARASIKIYDYVKIDGYMSYDHLFKWTGQGQLGLSFSFGPSKKVERSESGSCAQAMTMATRAYQPVDRFEIIPVDHDHTYDPAINPLTGAPYYFWFVNNLSHCDGSFESPCNTLVSLPNADVIYVYPGDGLDTGMNTGITLYDNQRLWGSVVAQNLPAKQGNVIVPTMSSGIVAGAVVAPIISNGTTDIVLLANNNEISGLFLQNSSISTCISGFTVSNATISNCTLAGPNQMGFTGINVQEFGGTLAVDHCVFNQQYGISGLNSSISANTIVTNSNLAGGGSTSALIQMGLVNNAEGTFTANNNLFSSAGRGVQIDLDNTSSILASLNNNRIETDFVGVWVRGTSTGTENITLNNNVITSHRNTVYVVQNGPLFLTMNGNTCNSDSNALEVDTIAGSASLLITGNTLNSSDNLCVSLVQTGGTLVGTFTDNTLVNNTDDYGFDSVMQTAAETQTLTMINNNIVAEYGAYIHHHVGDFHSTWTSNTISADNNPIYLEQSMTAQNHSIVMIDNYLVGEEGFYLDQEVGTFTGTIHNNFMANTIDNYALKWYTTGSAENTTFSITNNNLNGYSAIQVDQNAGNASITIADNLLQGYTAIYADTVANPSSTFIVTGNTCNGEQGIYINQSSGSLSTTIDNNLMYVADSSGISYTASGAAESSQLINNNKIYAGPSQSILFSLNSTGTTSATITNNILQTAGANSIVLTVFGGTQFLDLSDNTVISSGGFSIGTANSAVATWTVNGNEFVALNSTPVAATAADTSNLCMVFKNNTASPIPGAYSIQKSGSATITLDQSGNIGELTTNATLGTCP